MDAFKDRLKEEFENSNMRGSELLKEILKLSEPEPKEAEEADQDDKTEKVGCCVCEGQSRITSGTGSKLLCGNAAAAAKYAT